MSSCHLLPQAKVSLEHITEHINSKYNDDNKRPLVVGLSGLKGIGKTTLSHTLGYILEQEHGLQSATLSLDDTTTGYSLEGILATLKSWVELKEDYSVIFVEGSLVGYKALPPTHRIWSQLLDQPTNEASQSLKNFNDTLALLERDLYPFINIFIQLSANQLDEWRSSLGSQFSVYQLYLERLNNYGFFDQGSASTRNGSRHLVLYLDKDRKLIQQRKIVDGLIPHIEDKKNPSQKVPGLHSTKRIVGRRTWLMSSLVRQQRKYLIATLNPRVLISFAMMSLLGLLGYSRRLSFILDIFNKIHHFIL